MIATLRNILWPNPSRAFVTGPNTVSTADMAFGTAPETWAPLEYGEYIARSNAVYSCLKVRSDALASLPLKLYTGAGDNRKEITSGPVRELLDKVNPHWTWDQLLIMTSQSLDLWGSCFYFLERGQRGTMVPKEIYWARPDRVRIVPDPETYIRGYILQGINGGQDIAFDRSEVIWIRYMNPLDEYAGLSPLAAARLSADYGRDAMHANYNLFKQGMSIGGIIAPKDGQAPFNEDQAKQLQESFAKRMSGQDKAHRWAVLRLPLAFQPMTMTAKDAEFLGGLKWSLEDVCRAYRVPIDLIGGERTYSNAKEARYALWEDAIRPSARMIANALTEQLLPMFPSGPTIAEFRFDDVQVLQEAETEKWTREKEQLTAGVLIPNEWRKEKGLPPVAWGDAWWASSALVPISTEEQAAPPDPNAAPPADPNSPAQDAQTPQDAPPAKQDQQQPRRRTRALVEFGSAEHERLWNRRMALVDKHERAIAKATADLMRSQKQAMLAALRGRTARAQDPLEFGQNPFDLPRWIKQFRVTIRPVIANIARDAGDDELASLGLSMSFKLQDPNVVRAIEQAAQRFAVEVNQTTWDQLRASIAQGISSGETVDQIAQRVEDVMAARIRSSAEAIARTETIGASTIGSIESWRQSGVVRGKEWVAALDERTRDTHVAAHGQRVELDADFTVGNATGQGPARMSTANESVNCRCVLVAVLDTEWNA